MLNIQTASPKPLTAAWPRLDRHYLSATLGLICTLVGNPASANGSSPHAGLIGGTPLTFTPHTVSSSSPSGRPPLWASFPVHGATTPISGPSAGTGKFSNAVAGGNKQSIVSLPNAPDSLNLGSAQANFSLSGLGDAKTLTITVGGKSEVVNLATRLTASELLAADQVIAGGHQTLTIDAAGQATGGCFTLSNQSLNAIDASVGGLNALLVPQNVRIFDSLSNLQLSGDLINSGHIVIQPGTGNTSTIQAYDIINAAGATITGAASTGHEVNLSLVAGDQLVNNGLISSGQNLNISTPSVVNAGTLKSMTGNINFDSATTVTINNTGGTISAVQGNINVNTAASNGNVDINGGALLSNQLNINAGTGDVNLNVGNVTGVVNVDACSAHINAETANLQLGNLNVTGDPTYYNQGNITISGAMAPTNGNPLAIVASGNIISDGGSLDTSNTSGMSGAGGDLTLVAGAAFNTSDGSTSGSNNQTTTLTIIETGVVGRGSSTGGCIDLSGGHGGKAPVTAITTAGGGLIGGSGAVTMVAFAGSGAGSGTVTLPANVTLVTSTNAAIGKSGDVTIVAGATKGTAITVGNIDTSHGTLGQGSISLFAAGPPITGPLTIVNGAIATGSFTGLLFNTDGAIIAGNLTTAGGGVNISTLSSITFNTINTSGRGGNSAFQAAGNPGGNAGTVFVQTRGNITGNNVFAYGGGGGGGSIDATINGLNGGTGGNGNSIELFSNSGTVTIKGMLNASGGGGGGGAGASYNGTNSGTYGSGGTGGTAGNISITSFNGITVAGGIFSVNGGSGGLGGSVSASNSAGGGGGGGGSYGGGGGGGAAGNDQATGGFGGGGGGGLYGGGGGSGGVFSNMGGNGGGFQGGGLGGSGTALANNGLAGTKLSGGNGEGAIAFASVGLGGALGIGGLADLGANGTATAGLNVITGGTVGGGTLSLTTNTGTVGTQKAPLTTLVQALALETTLPPAPKADNFYINDGAGLDMSIVNEGAVSVTAAGNIILTSTGSNIARNLTLTTTPGSNGNIIINTGVTGQNITLQAGGAGSISTTAGQLIVANNLTLTSTSGAIGTNANAIGLGNSFTNLTANTNNSIYVDAQFNLTLDKSSCGSGNNLFDVTAGSALTVNGAVTAAGGNIDLLAGQGMTLAANVSASGLVSLAVLGSSNIVEKGIAIETGSIITTIGDGTVGTAKKPFVTDAGSVEVHAFSPGNKTAAYITDTNTGTASVASVGAQSGVTLDVISSASQLSIGTGAWTNASVSDISKNGSILINGPVGNGGNTFISTINGSVTQNLPTDLVNGQNVSFKSMQGSFGTVGTPLNVVASNLTFDTGKSATASFQDSSPFENIMASTAGTIVLDSMQTTIEGKLTGTASVTITNSGAQLNQQPGATITANTVSVTNTGGDSNLNAAIKASTVTLSDPGGNIFFTSPIGLGTGAITVTAMAAVAPSSAAALLSGTSVSIDAGGIGSTFFVNVATPSLTLETSGGAASVYVIGNTVLQNSTGIGSLFLTSNGNITQASNAQLVTNHNIIIEAKSFTQESGAVITAMGATSDVRITTTGMGDAINLEGMGLGGYESLTLTTAPKATVLIASGSLQYSPQMTIQTGNLINNGSIETAILAIGGTLTIENPTGNLTINNNSGAFLGSIGSNPLTFNASSGGNLTITNSGMFAPFASFPGSANVIDLSAKGTLTLPVNSLAVAPSMTTMQGGTITINAGNIVTPTGGMFLSADGPLAGAGGQGGNITLTITGKQNLSIDGTVWQFSAQGGVVGGSGGTVTISTGGSLFVNQTTGTAIEVTPTAANYNGGNISLSAGTNLAISGQLNTLGLGAGTEGAITLASDAKTPFFVYASTVPITNLSNGVNGIQGGVVAITSLAGITVQPGGTLQADGTLTLTTSNFSNDGTVMGAANFATITNPTGNLTIGGAGAFNSLPNLFSLTLFSGGNLIAGNIFNSLSGDTLLLQVTAKGTLTLGVTDIAVGTSLALPGVIDISAAKLAYQFPMTGPLTLDASGGPNTNQAGNVSLTLSGTAPLTISGTAPDGINIITVSPTNAGIATGGTVYVSNGGNLTVNPSGLNTFGSSMNFNNSVSFISSGALLVTGWNANIIGPQGTLVTSEKSSTPFIIGATTTTGINTGAVASDAIVGADLSITNTAGGVTLGGLDYLSAQQAGNQVTVSAAKSIIDSGAGNPEAINANAGTVTLISNGGSIGVPLTKAAPSSPLIMQAQNLSASAGKGDVLIVQNNAGTLTLGPSSGTVFNILTQAGLTVNGPISGSQITLTTQGSGASGLITIGNSIGNGTGAVTLTAGPAGTPASILQTAGTINATTLTLNALSVDTLVTNIAQLTANVTNNFVLNNLGTKLLTLNGNLGATPATNTTITTAGALTQTGLYPEGNNLIYNAGGAITINDALDATSVSLNSSNGGAITQGKFGSIGCTSLTLTSDTGNISSAKGAIAASNLTVGTAGTVTLTDNESTGDINVASTILPVASFSLNATTGPANNLFLNNIATTNGSISVIYNGGFLNAQPGAQLTANNGNITLQNTLASTGILFLSPGTNILASATAANFGNVNLLVGPAPAKPSIGVPPSNLSAMVSGKGTIFYNQTAAGNIISIGPQANSLNALDRNIDLSSSVSAGIVLSSSAAGIVTITADPPVTLATAPAATLSSVGSASPSSTAPQTPALSMASTGASIGSPLSAWVITSPAEPQINWSAPTITLGLIQNGGAGAGMGLDTSSPLSKAATDSTTLQRSLPVDMTKLPKNPRSQHPSTKDSAGTVSKVLGDEALLISPDTDTTIESKFGTVQLKSKCLALLVATDNGLTIFNLDDRSQDSVRARVGKETISLLPGRHMTISAANARDFATINPAQFVAHRRVREGTIGAFKTFQSEFQVLSALSGIHQLRQFMQSPDPAKQQTAKHLLKTAAILDGLSQGSTGQFELYSKNIVTAMNP